MNKSNKMKGWENHQMDTQLKKKAFLGLGRFFILLPEPLFKSEIRKSAQAICRETAHLNEEERRLHRFVVSTISQTNDDVPLSLIAEELDLTPDRVLEIVEKLEDLKVFFYRYNSPGINWAYPVTSEDRVYKLAFSDGKSCTAA
jgi:hypothetical protein